MFTLTVAAAEAAIGLAIVVERSLHWAVERVRLGARERLGRDRGSEPLDDDVDGPFIDARERPELPEQLAPSET